MTQNDSGVALTGADAAAADACTADDLLLDAEALAQERGEQDAKPNAEKTPKPHKPRSTRAKEDMFFFTSTADSPWIIIKSDDKKRARIAIRYLLSRIDYPERRDELLRIDRRVVRSVQEETGVED
jgi:hypothetical protein